MTKPITTLLFALIFFTGSACAQWMRISEGNTFTSYVDWKTIRKDGNLRKIWEIHDLKQRGKDGELSRMYRMEYDCKNESVRILAGTEHSEPMAGGTTLYQTTFENQPWTDIAPRSFGDKMLQVVCAK